MDIFNKKKIAELEKDNSRKDQKIHRLEDELAVLKIKLSEIQQYANTTPTDCIRGEWCKACEFCKSFYVLNYPIYQGNTIYICGKGESCKHFVQKERD